MQVPSHGVLDSVVSLVEAVEIVCRFCPAWARERLDVAPLSAMVGGVLAESESTCSGNEGMDILQQCRERLKTLWCGCEVMGES